MRELKRLHFYRPGPKMSLQPGAERSTAEPNLPELKTGEITLLADEERCVCVCVCVCHAGTGIPVHLLYRCPAACCFTMSLTWPAWLLP